MKEIRTRGYAVNNAESETDVSAVAAVVRDKRGRSRAAIATTAPKSRADKRWIESTGEATMRIAGEPSSRVG